MSSARCDTAPALSDFYMAPPSSIAPGRCQVQGQRAFTPTIARLQLYVPRSGATFEAYSRGEIVYVRAIAFVDVELDGESHRWEWTPSVPEAVPFGRSATSQLVDLARSVEARTRDRLLADARVAGLRVGRWEMESAPRRIELDPSLDAQLVLD